MIMGRDAKFKIESAKNIFREKAEWRELYWTRRLCRRLIIKPNVDCRLG